MEQKKQCKKILNFYNPFQIKNAEDRENPSSAFGHRSDKI